MKYTLNSYTSTALDVTPKTTGPPSINWRSRAYMYP